MSQIIHKKQSVNSLFPPEDKDFNSSCCDYNSEVFKEQPSQVDYSNISGVNNNQMFGDLVDQDENFLISPASYKGPSSQNDPTGSLRINMISKQKVYSNIPPTGQSHTHKNSNQQMGKILRNHTHGIQSAQKQSESKEICEQSLLQAKSAYTNSNQVPRRQKRPLYSLVPDQINKNLTKDFVSLQKQEPESVKQANSMKSKSRQQNNMILSQDIKSVNNENVNIMFCEESEIITRNHIVASNSHQTQLNLTPHKKLPVPVSPSQRPILSNCNSGIQSCHGRQQQSINCVMCPQQQKSEIKPSHLKNCTNSEQKPSVQYNEFKYYTSGNQINPDNMKKYINISSNGFQRKSDIQSSHNMQYELSPCDHRMFDASSPLNSVSAASNYRNSLRKQFVGISNQIQENRNYQLQLKADSSSLPSDSNQAYELKIKELQDYVVMLESDLKQSHERNAEIQKKVKEKSFIQSFDKKANKHLSDTEDSLILSEKKVMKRQSLNGSVKPPNQTLLTKEMPSQSCSSIVDVKIRPISNIKHNLQSSPATKQTSSASIQQKDQRQKQLTDSNAYLDQDEELEYQVADLNEDITQQNLQQEENQQSPDEQEEEECEGCERLKQLVFQAKEAIDDLKAEIEEWREICAEKETELRQLHHRLYNDLIGTEKKIQFKDDAYIKEFDQNRPANFDSKKIKNFIKQNKNRIMTRSKNKQDKKVNCREESAAKKTSLKDVKEAIGGNGEEVEFYEAEDQGIQTSFIMNDYMVTSNDNTSRIDNNCRSDQKLNYISNSTTTNNLSPYKQQIQPFDLKENEVPLTDEKLCNNEGKEINQQQLCEEINNLRYKNHQQEQESITLKSQVNLLTKQCEQFVSLMTKARRKSKKATNIDFNELKETCEIVSNLESYSILEKINEWKREEGLDCTNLESQQSQIPRPMKLINEITLEDLEQLEQPIAVTQSPQNDFRNYIKQEQETLRKLQELKLKEYQKQQNDYLQYLRGVQ